MALFRVVCRCTNPMPLLGKCAPQIIMPILFWQMCCTGEDVWSPAQQPIHEKRRRTAHTKYALLMFLTRSAARPPSRTFTTTMPDNTAELRQSVDCHCQPTPCSPHRCGHTYGHTHNAHSCLCSDSPHMASPRTETSATGVVAGSGSVYRGDDSCVSPVALRAVLTSLRTGGLTAAERARIKADKKSALKKEEEQKAAEGMSAEVTSSGMGQWGGKGGRDRTLRRVKHLVKLKREVGGLGDGAKTRRGKVLFACILGCVDEGEM